jgi:hypothetical protein
MKFGGIAYLLFPASVFRGKYERNCLTGFESGGRGVEYGLRDAGARFNLSEVNNSVSAERQYANR